MKGGIDDTTRLRAATVHGDDAEEIQFALGIDIAGGHCIIMNTHMAAEEEIEDFDEFEPDEPSSGFGLRDGGTDLFRGVLVALVALAVGAFVLTQGYGDDTPGPVDDESTLTSGELTAADPDGSLTTDGTEDSTDPAAPAAGDAMTDDAMTDDAAGDDAAEGDAMTDDTATGDATTETSEPATTETTANLAGTARPAAEVEVVVLNATEQKGIAGQATELVGGAGYTTVPAGNATQSMGSIIYYTEGYRADAIAVAQVFTDGLEGLVQPYDPTSPPAELEDIDTANVIVVLGIDDAIPLG